MERHLVLGRKDGESISLFSGGMKVAEIECRQRTTLVVTADDDVRIVRTELLEPKEPELVG